MGKTLVIVESPKKAGLISKILGDKYIVKASVGHIVELAKGGHHGIGVDIENGYKPRYTLMEDKVKVLKDIIEELKKCDDVILLSDPDREGISIGWHIYQRIKDFDKPIKMTTTNEISKNKIKQAFKELRDIDMNMVRAQEARRVLDRIVGFTVSPFLTTVENTNLSAGRVQSVAVRLIIDREEEINNFKSETYYTIDGNLLTKNKENVKVSLPAKITDKSVGDEIHNELNNSTFSVKSINDDFEYKSPPAPMITSTLQQTMARIHNFSADQTMKAAQSLYEAGLITYLRTDSPAISKDALEMVRDYLKNNNHKIPNKPNEFDAKKNAQEAHECIRPVNVETDFSSGFFDLSDEEKKVYDIIWKYFVASQCEDAKYSTRKIIFEASNSDVFLQASGKCLVESNFMDILGKKDDSKIDIPNLSVGDILTVENNNSINLNKKKTQPPPRFALDKLLQTLENKGIGRPSTFADILSKIESRNYVEKKGNVYHPTELGKKVIKILKNNFDFIDYDFTSKMESDLDLIAEGKLTYEEMLNSFYPKFKSNLDSAYVSNKIPMCPSCNSPMVYNKEKTSQYCSNYKKCKKGNK